MGKRLGDTRTVFKRPMRRTVLETLVSAVSGALFLLAAYLLATQGFILAQGDSSGSALGVRVIGPLIFSLLGVLMALAGLVGARRLVQPTILEVDADGLWSPATGRLSWSDISEIRLEKYAAPAGRRGGTMVVQRLGIVPVDPTRIHLAWAERAVQLLSRAYMATVGRAGRFWTGTGAVPRFGLGPRDFDAPFDEVLLRVGEYFPISEAVSPR